MINVFFFVSATHMEKSNGSAIVPYSVQGVQEQRLLVEEMKPKKTPRSSNMPTIEQFIASSFANQLRIFDENETQLKIGDAILARMKGYDPWPARLLSFKNKNRMVECYFFGAHNKGNVGIKNIIPFTDGLETIRLICIRNPKNFVKGINEIEIEYGIPREHSMLVYDKILNDKNN